MATRTVCKNTEKEKVKRTYSKKKIMSIAGIDYSEQGCQSRRITYLDRSLQWKKKPCFIRGRDRYTAWCLECLDDFGIGHSGDYDLQRHLQTEKHKKNKGFHLKQKAVTTWLVKPPKTAGQSLELATTTAEVRMTELIAECNMSFQKADKLVPMLKEIAPDQSSVQSKLTNFINNLYWFWLCSR